MTILYYIYVFIVGLVVGSFLNVCISRLPEGKSILSPPSHCTSCGSRLKPLELIPILSYLFLKAKCKHCGERISIKYPLIEFLTGIVFVILFWRFGLTIDFIASIFLISILIAVFFIDIEHLIIPDELVITGLVGGVLLLIYIIFTSNPVFEDSTWLGHLLGLLPGSGLLFLVALIGLLLYKSDDVMGMGDVKIFAPIGIFLGWKLCIFAMMASVIFAGLFSVTLMIFGLKKRKDTIPFGPFIVTGAFIALLWGNQLIQWYLSTYY